MSYLIELASLENSCGCKLWFCPPLYSTEEINSFKCDCGEFYIKQPIENKGESENAQESNAGEDSEEFGSVE